MKSLLKVVPIRLSPSLHLDDNPARVTPAQAWTLRRARPEHDRLLLEVYAGAALETLSQLTSAQRSRLVVVTENPCPEYALDLCDFEPGVLLTGSRSTAAEISRALERVETGQPRISPPGLDSLLLPSERAILRFLPAGTCNKRIARSLGLSHRTVRNRLVNIAEKLKLENRTQIAMYYTGQWQWLSGYRARLADANVWQERVEPVACAAD